MTDRRHNILVTGVGAIIGYGIVKSLRRSKLDCRVVGMDLLKDAYGGFLADHFAQAVPADSDEYVPFLRGLVAAQQIDLIIPGCEQDLYSLWEHRHQVPTRIVLNNDLCIRLSRNKLDTYRYFSQIDAPFAIPTLHDCTYAECVSRLGSPFILKLASSYASKGLQIIHSAEEFERHVAEVGASRCIYQRRVGNDEEEYTVGAFGDGRGSYFDSVILRRRLSREGATQVAVWVEQDHAVTDCVDSIFSTLKPVGPTNIQIRVEDGRAYLLEINPRISSTCSIRTAIGYNEPEMCVRYFLLGEACGVAPKRALKAVRYIEDHLIDVHRGGPPA
ncbi:MAG: ATP-grasp domain-containing protein [Planctomycetota bacterium]